VSGFKDAVLADVKNVFLNLDEFAEPRTVIYDGTAYEAIPVVLTGPKEQSRRQLANDHAEGFYLVSAVMHCAVSDLGGNVPEKGTRIEINDGDFFRTFYVASSVCEFGMVRAELEAIDE
jgi:hypothetical protein